MKNKTWKITTDRGETFTVKAPNYFKAQSAARRKSWHGIADIVLVESVAARRRQKRQAQKMFAAVTAC